MPQLQLAATVFLVCCAIVSGVAIFYQGKAPDREIQLPINNDEIPGLDDGTKSDDPFEVTTPEDVIDGYPVAERKFWVRVRNSC